VQFDGLFHGAVSLEKGLISMDGKQLRLASAVDADHQRREKATNDAVAFSKLGISRLVVVVAAV